MPRAAGVDGVGKCQKCRDLCHSWAGKKGRRQEKMDADVQGQLKVELVVVVVMVVVVEDEESGKEEGRWL